MNKIYNDPIRIAVIMGKYTPGGIKSVIMNYYRKINKANFQFDFFIYEDSPDNNYDEILALGGRVYKISNIKNPVSFIYDLWRILKKNRYLIVHGYLNTLNIFPMFAAYLSRVPVRIAENLSTAHKGERKTLVKNILKPLAKIFSTALAANSLYSAEWLYPKNYKKCFIIRNALDITEYYYDEESRNKTRKELKVEKKFVIGHVGRFAYQKNHSFLIDIFNDLLKIKPDSILLLIGYGELLQEIRDKVVKYGIQDKVIFGGETENLFPLYNAMDCFVLPSFYEGLPVVGIEAQAFCLPCFFSNAITFETKISDNVVFISLNESSQRWAELIAKSSIIKRKKLETCLTENGYNLEKEVQRLERYYYELINSAKVAHLQ